MDSWRDQGVSSNQEVTRTKSNSYRNPPTGGNSNWQQSVPSWEKKFIASIGSIPWKKLVETKKFIHLYDNIIKWNDSAGKEAFENAKNNFYANMYNLHHNICLPDPDIYIDKINWDSEVDENLILDLESDSVCPDSNSKEEQVIIFGSSFPPSYQSFSPYGWGDSDDEKNKDKDPNTYRWEVEGNEGGGFDNSNNWWGWNENDETGKRDHHGWGDSRNDYWGWSMYDDNNYFYGDVKNEHNMSRYKTSRFRKDDNRARRNNNNNNGNVRKSGNSCGVNPSSHGGVVGHRWSVKKSVS